MRSGYLSLIRYCPVVIQLFCYIPWVALLLCWQCPLTHKNFFNEKMRFDFWIFLFFACVFGILSWKFAKSNASGALLHVFF